MIVMFQRDRDILKHKALMVINCTFALVVHVFTVMHTATVLHQQTQSAFLLQIIKSIHLFDQKYSKNSNILKYYNLK